MRTSLRTLAVPAGVAALLSVAACSTSAPRRDAGGESAARIIEGMARLGASPGRSACYASSISAALSAPDAGEAIDIIEGSASKDDMRNGVLDASPAVRQSFIRAHLSCSLSR
ncbi:MAG: hypothetical protein ACKVS5_02975 [Parvularculaceae bacterium]